ncbi:MAG TPA: ATP-binding protein, partial [Candidatus Limnocylindrales bacterium]|nr:ATP-binding protein [Candidatus Limnocylindrales bacterium]
MTRDVAERSSALRSPGALAELVSDIVGAAAGEDDLGRILHAALERLARVVPFTGGSIALVEGETLVIRAAIGPFAERVLGQRVRRGPSRSWRVIETREPLLEDDLPESAVPTVGPHGERIRSWLAVPLVRHGEAIGLLEVDSTEPGVFEPADVAVVQAVALAVSGPVELAGRLSEIVRLNEELRARERQQAAVARLGQAAVAEVRLADLLEEAARVGASIVEADRVLVVESSPDGLRVVASSGRRAGTGSADVGPGGWAGSAGKGRGGSESSVRGEGPAGQASAASASPAGAVTPPGAGTGASGASDARPPDASEPDDRRAIQPPDGSALEEALREREVVVLDGYRPRDAEVRLLGARPVDGLVVPIPGRGRPFGLLVVVRRGRPLGREDAPPFVAIANVLSAAIRRHEDDEIVRHAAAIRQAFIEVISHELRTPITTLYGDSLLLLRPESRLGEAERRELLADIAAEAERLDRLVGDLIVLTRAERGGVEVGREPVHLARIIDRVVAAEAERWPGCRFEVRVTPGLPPVAGEETYVAQVLRNLLSNAAKYGPPDGRVVLAARASRGHVEVRILDEGPGIDPSEVERLFDLFYRSARTADRASGAGIGLFVCRHLVEAMGGRIWARPRPEGGTELGFTLVVHPDAVEPAGSAGSEDADPSVLASG